MNSILLVGIWYTFSEKFHRPPKERIEVPDTEVASRVKRKQKHKREGHMGKERELREKRRILINDAKDLHDELDAIFFKIAQVNKEIEEQVEKQVVEQ